MPTVCTVFRPWEEVEVSEEEAVAMTRMGLLAPDAIEGVTDGSSEEEGRGEAPGLQQGGDTDQPQGGRQPRSRTTNPRVRDPKGRPGSEAGEPATEEHPDEEGLTG